MASLSKTHRVFIIERLARFDQPSEVRDEFEDTFGEQLPLDQIMYYDPTTARGSDQLAQKWKDLFWSTREKFLSETRDIAIANKAYRLRQLQKDLEKCERMGNIPLKLEVLEQAAKEVGDKYTNRQEISGPEGGDVPVKIVKGVSMDDL